MLEGGGMDANTRPGHQENVCRLKCATVDESLVATDLLPPHG